MNTDIGELLERIEVKNPINVGVVAGLVVSLVLFGVVLSGLVGVMLERFALQEEYQSAVSSIERIRTAQQQSPEKLRQRIAEAKEELGSLLADIPTRREARAEIVKYYTYASNVNTELVRMERVAAGPEAGGEGFYDTQQFLLEAQGLAPNLMRFLARVGSGPYDTFILSNIRISPDGPSTAEADLEIYSSELSADEPLPASTPVATPPPEEGSLGPDRDRALELSDGFHEAVIAGDWKQVVSLGERFLGLEMESEYTRMAVYEGHVRVGYDLLADGRAMEAREHFQRALVIIPGGREAQEGLEAVETGMLSHDAPDGDTATTTPIGERPASMKVHVVRRGESLSLLAQRYDTTVQELMQANDLQRTTIYVGQKLVVPAR